MDKHEHPGCFPCKMSLILFGKFICPPTRSKRLGGGLQAVKRSIKKNKINGRFKKKTNNTRARARAPATTQSDEPFDGLDCCSTWETVLKCPALLERIASHSHDPRPARNAPQRSFHQVWPWTPTGGCHYLRRLSAGLF